MNWISWSRRFGMLPRCWPLAGGSARSPFILSKIVSSSILSDPSHRDRKPPFPRSLKNRSFLLRPSVKRIRDHEALNYELLNANQGWGFYEDLHRVFGSLSCVCVCVGAGRRGSHRVSNRTVEA